MSAPENVIPASWGEYEMSIYRAALTDYIANKDFFGAWLQGSPLAAHKFAMRAVHVAKHGAEPEE